MLCQHEIDSDIAKHFSISSLPLDFVLHEYHNGSKHRYRGLAPSCLGSAFQLCEKSRSLDEVHSLIR